MCRTDANKTFSLFGLMNRTCTAGMGKRLLNRWLKQPLLDVEQVGWVKKAWRYDKVAATMRARMLYMVARVVFGLMSLSGERVGRVVRRF